MVLNKLLNNDPISFYWMGFILADGWVSSRIDTNGSRVNHIGISLKHADDDHLKEFVKWLGLDEDKVRYRQRNTNFKTSAESSNVCITDHHNVPLIKDKFGISNQKTYLPPNMVDYKFEQNLMIALIIGFIDGDGSIDIRSKHRPHISIQTTKEWKDNLEFMNKSIHEFGNEPVRNKVLINTREHATLSICKRKLVVKLMEFISKHNLPILKRKWGKIDAESLMSPIDIDNGARYKFTNTSTGQIFDNEKSLLKFCTTHGLNTHKFNNLTLNGGGCHDGWEVVLISPIKRKTREGKKHSLEKDGIIYNTTNLKDFCRNNNLEYHKMLKLCNGTYEYDGWKVINA